MPKLHVHILQKQLGEKPQFPFSSINRNSYQLSIKWIVAWRRNKARSEVLTVAVGYVLASFNGFICLPLSSVWAVCAVWK